MRTRQILSAPSNATATPAGVALVFDACQVGVVLRAVVLVEVVLAVGLLYVTLDVAGWLQMLAFATAGALPATLLWLIIGCGFKQVLRRLSWSGQTLAGALLGVLAALFAGTVLSLTSPGLRLPWLALAGTGALLGAALVLGLIWRVRGRTPAATAARLLELQARIHPHFLFNSLNTAIALVHDEPAQAERVLEDLSDLFHEALGDPHDHSTLAHEVELARRYLEIEQLRFGARLRVHWHLEPRCAGARLPPLVLQPLVENAIRHGVEPSADGADVSIRSVLSAGMVVVEITNTVPQGAGTAGNGIALANVRERLRLLHDLHGQLHTGRDGGVFRVRLEVPL